MNKEKVYFFNDKEEIVDDVNDATSAIIRTEDENGNLVREDFLVESDDFKPEDLFKIETTNNPSKFVDVDEK